MSVYSYTHLELYGHFPGIIWKNFNQKGETMNQKLQKQYNWALGAKAQMYQNKLIVDMLLEHFTVSNKLETYNFLEILNSAEVKSTELGEV